MRHSWGCCGVLDSSVFSSRGFLNLLGAGFWHVADFGWKIFLPGQFRRSGRRRFPFQRVHDFGDHEDAESDNGEVDHSVDE